MNKLIFPNGGVPLQGDDFRFMQDALRDATNAPMQGLGSLPFIVYGCDFTINGSNMQVNEGYVFLENELCYVPSSTVPYAPNLEIYLDISYSPQGLEIAANGQSINTYQLRIGKVGSNPNQLINPLFIEEQIRLDKIIYDNILNKAIANIGYTLIAAKAYTLNFFVKRFFNTIKFQGILNITHVLAGYNHVGTLDINHRPLQNVFFTVIGSETSVGAPVDVCCFCKIEPDGKIYINTNGNTNIFSVSLDSVMFFI